MREQRKRKALYVNRREELYTDVLLRKERAPTKAKKNPARKAGPGGSPRRVRKARG